MSQHNPLHLLQMLHGIAMPDHKRSVVEPTVVEFEVAIERGRTGGQLAGRTAAGVFSYDSSAVNSHSGFARLLTFEMDFFGLGDLTRADIEHAGFYLSGKAPLSGDIWDSVGLLGTDILMASFNQNAPGGFRYFDRSNYAAGTNTRGFFGTVSLVHETATT